MRSTIGFLCAAALASAAYAQPCTPQWDTTIGNPGAADGYVGAFTKYDGKLVLSGSFTSAGSTPLTTYLASYDESANTWGAFATGLGRGSATPSALRSPR